MLTKPHECLAKKLLAYDFIYWLLRLTMNIQGLDPVQNVCIPVDCDQGAL